MRFQSLIAFAFVLMLLPACSVDYSSSKACANTGECFLNEICLLDENGTGRCEIRGDSLSDAEVLSPADVQSMSDIEPRMEQMMNSAEDMTLDTSQMELSGDAGVATDAEVLVPMDASSEIQPDLVCPPSDDLVASRFECAYTDAEQRRDYCQYYISEAGTRHNCQAFCESIGLFTCADPAACCWNNLTESNCSVDVNESLSCSEDWDSVICRCFETAP